MNKTATNVVIIYFICKNETLRKVLGFKTVITEKAQG